MTDPRLILYVEAITSAHETALKTAREQAGEEAWVSMEFPRVTLILPGLIVQGNLISYLEYFKLMRTAITSARGDKRSKEVILGLFAEPNITPDVEEDIKLERIYLSGVHITSGDLNLDGTKFTCRQLSIQLNSIQGWTMQPN